MDWTLLDKTIPVVAEFYDGCKVGCQGFEGYRKSTDLAQNDLVLAAAAIAGVDRVFTIGGAQAVAAMAYGTESVPQVDKIVGPGNAYVAEAKRRVFGTVGIDMIAGPSEIQVICDGQTHPDWIAMDLFSQAEHDELAQSILLTPDASFADKVEQSIKKLVGEMPRNQVITTSISNRGAIIVTRDLDEAAEISNRIAPEHLELSLADPLEMVKKIQHAWNERRRRDERGVAPGPAAHFSGGGG